MKKPCESCIDYDKKLCRSQELLNQEKQLVADKEKAIQAVEERTAVSYCLFSSLYCQRSVKSFISSIALLCLHEKVV